MQAWLSACESLVGRLMGFPRAAGEMGLLLFVAILSLVVIMRVVAGAMGIADRGQGRQILSVALGVMVLVAAGGLVSAHLIRLLPQNILRVLVAVGVPLLAGLAVAVPLQMLVLKSRYMPTLIAFAGAVGSCILLLLLVNAVLDSVRAGGEESSKIRKRKQVVEDFINR
jgi:hypothetical protein